MGARTRGRLVVFLALSLLGIGVALAVADNLPVVSPRTVEPHGDVSPPLGDVTDDSATPSQDVRGADATSRDGHAKADRSGDARDKRGDGRGEGADETEIVAALIPARSGGAGIALPCADTNTCVDRVGELITNVVDRVPDLPVLRDCTSSIGGDATCFDFGSGNYLVGDAPTDGEAELGFCTSSGYYYVSGPSLDGGVGAACPDDRAGGNRRDRGDAPSAHDCTSSSGGEATCFDFGDGKYIVSDPASDGEGELGFCSGSDYYYVSAPSADGEAGAKCPAARAAG